MIARVTVGGELHDFGTIFVPNVTQFQRDQVNLDFEHEVRLGNSIFAPGQVVMIEFLQDPA